jgi:L,D-transpeptidase ErfK/SrfK
MKIKKGIATGILTLLILLMPGDIRIKQPVVIVAEKETTSTVAVTPDTIIPRLFTIIPRNIPIKAYFRYLNKIVRQYDTLVPYPLSEQLLVRANPWIIDTLESTDYYRMKKKGIKLYSQPDAIVLHRGDTLFFPDSLAGFQLLDRIQNTLIDVNIPEYRLRILEYGDTLYSFPVRVGQNKARFLKTVGRVVDLRTKTGAGNVIRINRYPVFIDPVTGDTFVKTKRDDRVVTKMPQIPWIEVELNGKRYGQLIHPTSNQATVGKMYSNGCVGLKEADAWRFYYYAPIGTPVVFRYDLTIIGVAGDTILLPDIYKRGAKKEPLTAVIRVDP